MTTPRKERPMRLEDGAIEAFTMGTVSGKTEAKDQIRLPVAAGS